LFGSLFLKSSFKKKKRVRESDFFIFIKEVFLFRHDGVSAFGQKPPRQNKFGGVADRRR